jgi:hypothetical protein
MRPHISQTAIFGADGADVARGRGRGRVAPPLRAVAGEEVRRRRARQERREPELRLLRPARARRERAVLEARRERVHSAQQRLEAAHRVRQRVVRAVDRRAVVEALGGDAVQLGGDDARVAKQALGERRRAQARLRAQRVAATQAGAVGLLHHSVQLCPLRGGRRRARRGRGGRSGSAARGRGGGRRGGGARRRGHACATTRGAVLPDA